MVTGEHEVPLTGAYTNKKENYKDKRNNGLIYVRVFTALAIWSSLGIFSLYLESFGLTESNIGYLFSIASLLAILVYLTATSILERISKATIFFLSVILMATAYILMGLTNTLTIFLIGFYIIFTLTILKNLAFEIMFRDNTTLKKLNKQEGRLMALRNIGVAAGPLIAALILFTTEKFTYIFFFSGITLLASAILFKNLKLPNNVKKRETIDDNTFKNIGSYLKEKNLRLPYLMSVGASSWWTFIHVYIPLFMVAKGLSTWTVGLFLAAVIIPLILFEEKIGGTVHKYGFRKFFMIGFGGLFMTCILLFFAKEILFQLFLLTLASFFAAFLGPNIHPYFFKRTKKRDEEKYYPVFGTSFGVGTFLGKFLVASVLLYFSNQFAYLIMATFMAIFLGLASKIPKNLS